MKATTSKEPIRTCPRCGASYRAVPALSRVDNATEICPDCGILEALESIGCSEDERLHILDLVRAYKGGHNG